MAIRKPCCYPGCPRLIGKGAYCEQHKATAKAGARDYDRHVRRKDPALALAARIRSSPRWQAIRRNVMSNHPLCADPFGNHARLGVIRSSQQVHHINPLGTHPELAYHAENLLAVCTACHAKIEREARRYPIQKPIAPPEPSSNDWRPFG
jgi:5-methylcytosine-specific restriction endonuclease McrA